MRASSRGFSLVELAVALAVLGVLLATGASSFSTWITNMRVRATADSIVAGLQLARMEAVRRNDLIRFQLVSSMGADCVASTNVANWVVSFDVAAGNCGGATINEAFAVSDTTNNPAPRIIQRHESAQDARKVVLSTNQSNYTFNGIGRLMFAPGITPEIVRINVGSTNGNCQHATPPGQVRCLRIEVAPGGQIRMCDPKYQQSQRDPAACTPTA